MTAASNAPDDDPEPQPPRAPEKWECCGSGCEPCVYDLYWEAMDRFERALQEWQVRRRSPPGAD